MLQLLTCVHPVGWATHSFFVDIKFFQTPELDRHRRWIINNNSSKNETTEWTVLLKTKREMFV